MVARTSAVGSYVTDEVLDAPDINDLPGGWLGAEVEVGPVSCGTSDTVVVGETVTVEADRFIKISASGTVLDDDHDSVNGEFWIEMDGADIGRVHRHPDGDDRSYIGSHTWYRGPSAGSHVFQLVGTTTAGEMSVTGARILIEDCGPES